MKPRSVVDFIPQGNSLPVLREAIQKCRAGSGLYRGVTQAVFGEDRKTATVMFIGEQPGDEGDRIGRRFVGNTIARDDWRESRRRTSNVHKTIECRRQS